jgi:hypothetical protein
MDVPVYLSKYKLGKTLGIGAFGKVKRKCHYPYPSFYIPDCLFTFLYSCAPCDHWPEGRREDPQQGTNQAHGNGRESAAGN